VESANIVYDDVILTIETIGLATANPARVNIPGIVFRATKILDQGS